MYLEASVSLARPLKALKGLIRTALKGRCGNISNGIGRAGPSRIRSFSNDQPYMNLRLRRATRK